MVIDNLSRVRFVIPITGAADPIAVPAHDVAPPLGHPLG
jgi:hypothetical protein